MRAFGCGKIIIIIIIIIMINIAGHLVICDSSDVKTKKTPVGMSTTTKKTKTPAEMSTSIWRSVT